MKAESKAPKFAVRSARLLPLASSSVAPGDLLGLADQQSAAGAWLSCSSSIWFSVAAGDTGGFLAQPPGSDASRFSVFSAMKFPAFAAGLVVTYSFTVASYPCCLTAAISSSTVVVAASNLMNSRSRSSSDSKFRSNSSSTNSTPFSPARAFLTLFGQSSHKIFWVRFIPGMNSVTSVAPADSAGFCCSCGFASFLASAFRSASFGSGAESPDDPQPAVRQTTKLSSTM